MINVSYYSAAIPESGAIRVGAIFPESDASIAIPVPQGFFFFPIEKEETILENGNVGTDLQFPDQRKGVGIYCRITYQQAPIPAFNWTPSYCTYQPLYVTSDGRWYPSDSEPAEIT